MQRFYAYYFKYHSNNIEYSQMSKFADVLNFILVDLFFIFMILRSEAYVAIHSLTWIGYRLTLMFTLGLTQPGRFLLVDHSSPLFRQIIETSPGAPPPPALLNLSSQLLLSALQIHY